ncbi:hypothetical protein BKH41_08980 [Helicobacter sp. 12S02232-10]|uniref:DinB family protein n=1 Tax=Helicobacter sp. 12S02232-10 TaxID=1476197 RepID=UPI000BA69AE4|nr:DinB family protein [Helicobacter sp. 12S02232-10]PAF46578.1 hypothetical protein BKH41_08980 [Helicobacter sp. 12S02232-10]
MKEILRLHAKYNQVANTQMIECLKGLPQADFNKDMGLYFKSIAGVFEHILAVDALIFGNMFVNYSAKKLDASSIVRIAESDTKVTQEVKSSMKNLFEARQKVDNFMIELVENVNDFSKIETLEFPGVKFEKPIYHFLISIFTHSTHHRGQIAAALDMLGVANDFNGMMGV